jgi:hypothetical protein
MEELKQLSGFYHSVADDPRISPTHISVYMALFQCWNLQSFQNPVEVNRREIMKLAKISGNATYHKCIRELGEYGYIEYLPSFDPLIKSLVFME